MNKIENDFQIKQETSKDVINNDSVDISFSKEERKHLQDMIFIDEAQEKEVNSLLECDNEGEEDGDEQSYLDNAGYRL